MLEITFGDDVFEYDPDSLLMSEYKEVKRVTGLGRKEWLVGLAESDIEAVQALIYLLRRRRGDDIRIGDVDGVWSSFTARDLNPPAEGDGEHGEPANPTEGATSET